MGEPIVNAVEKIRICECIECETDHFLLTEDGRIMCANCCNFMNNAAWVLHKDVDFEPSGSVN